jgi:hypothetical protein
MTTREQAHTSTDEALALAGMCHVIFNGESPDVVGAALAEVMATYLRGFENLELREVVFDQWIKTARNILLIYDKPPVGMQ